MKILTRALLILISLVPFFSCAQLPEKTKWHYFNKYSEKQKTIITENWKEYFESDITKDLDASIQMSPVWLDTYGGVYPDFELLKGMSFKPFSKKKPKQYQYKFSFFHFFESNSTNRDLFISKLKEKKPEIADSVSKLFQTVGFGFETSLSLNQRLELFYIGWNKFFNQVKYDELKQKLALEHKKSIFFFTHGFNVPYSLGVVQCEQYYHLLKDSLNINMDTVLFVPVFWTSGAEKDCNLSPKTFNIKNHTGIFDGGLKSKKQFKFYSNHCYSASLTLREMINHLDDRTSVCFFAHSLGATIATSTFINTYKRYDYAENSTLYPFIQRFFGILNNDDFKKAYQDYSKGNSFGVNQVLTGFKTIPLPTAKKVRVFLSAPAIPGKNTFVDLVDAPFRPANEKWDIKFYCTSNVEDPMLTKSMIPLLNVLGFANAYNHGATSLGSDFNHEIDCVDSVFLKSKGPKFISESVQLGDHDVFLYMDQPVYRKLTIKFVCDSTTKLSIDTLFKLEVNRLENSYNLFRLRRKGLANFKMIKYDLIYSDFNKEGLTLATILYDLECRNRNYEREVLCDTAKRLLLSLNNPYHLALLERSLIDLQVKPTTYDIQQRLIDETGKMMKLIDKKEQNFYTYQSRDKKLLKFIHIRTGNDLFQLQLISKNYDRDYTGSLNIEIGTDYLNPGRKRVLKSYQTIGYGFDVFTPQFNDSLKFKKFDDYDSLDRPHACFQYVQWSKKGLSRTNRLRWSTTIKIGIIGGSIGNIFQTVLHQDVSYSLRPKGWDVQIADGGRLGTSFELKHEYIFKIRKNKVRANPTSFFNSYFVPSHEIKFGSYMTNLNLGLTLTNKKFEDNNHHFGNKRSNLGHFNIWDHLMYRINITGTYVKHNTMLEGFGYMKTSETNPKKVDALTPTSDYMLTPDLVNRFIHYVNFTLSYTTRNFTLFYNYFLFSPETKLGKLNAINPNRPDINVGKRYHVFAEIGMNFSIK